MGFIKIGDPVKIESIIADGKVILCKQCKKPMATIAIDENDRVKAVCECEYPESE